MLEKCVKLQGRLLGFFHPAHAFVGTVSKYLIVLLSRLERVSGPLFLFQTTFGATTLSLGLNVAREAPAASHQSEGKQH